MMRQPKPVEAETALRATENQHRQLALLAKQHRLVLGVLKDLECA